MRPGRRIASPADEPAPDRHRVSPVAPLTLALRGPAGEPVDLARIVSSHGLAELAPMRVVDDRRRLEVTLATSRGPRTVTVGPGGPRRARVEVPGRAPGTRQAAELLTEVRHVLSLDDDLSGFYALAGEDPDLGWVTAGAGRMARGQTVFEDVIKTICTTNCAWSATERMIGAIVGRLGAPAPGAPAEGPLGRAFPTAAAMAAAGESFYRDVVRAGYRARSLHGVALAVAEGRVDLEALAPAPREAMDDDEVGAALEALPGVGPYAAAHVMMLIGRPSRLILDSWTRPAFARRSGRRRASDRTIERRFRRYGPHAGLALWLFLTREWVDG